MRKSLTSAWRRSPSWIRKTRLRAKDFPGKTPAVAPVVAVVVVAVTAAAAEVGPTDCVPIPSMLRVSGGAIVVAGEVGPAGEDRHIQHRCDPADDKVNKD
jgi:hypothetical protein